uniref:Parvovirus non-structural protein 1 helicase domain-containing protein n=1 Tax=Clastoptera arizonana TaxID=38151 RepID=A0A1B6E3N7_9HEMI
MKRWESCCTDEGDYRSKSPVTDQGQRDRKEKHYSFFARWLRKGKAPVPWLEKVLKNLTSPLENIFQCDVWVFDPVLQRLRPRDGNVETAANTISLLLIEWKVVDILHHYINNVPLFRASSLKNFEKLYLNMYDSYDLISRLLYFHLNSLNDIRNFLTLCRKMHDREDKSIAIYITGESNGGKTFFLDSLACFFLNNGYLMNPSKGYEFALEQCDARQIIYWDEARLDGGLYDKIKRILKGKRCSVKVKLRNELPLVRTPFLILSVDDSFAGHDELRDGLVTYNWYKYPYWEDDKNTFNKFINPFAIGMFMAWASEIPGLNYEDVELSLKHGKQYNIETYKYCNKFYYEQ